MATSSAEPRGRRARPHGAFEALRRGPLAPFLTGRAVLEVGGAPAGEQLAADGSQDVVVAVDRLQEQADYRAAIRTWFAAVKEGGHLVLVTPHAFLHDRQFAPPSRRSPGARRLYTPRSLLDEVEEALAPNSYRVRLAADGDDGYDYAGGSDAEPQGAADVLVALQKIVPPTWEPSAAHLLEPPRNRGPVHPFEPPRTRVEFAALRPRRRVLITKLDHLGDFIMGLGALERARAVFADAEITLVVGSWNAAMARDLGLADRVLEFDAFPRNSSEEEPDVPGRTALFQALVTEGYDVAIDLRTDTDTRFLLRGVRAGVRAGVGTRSRFPFLDIFLPIDGTRNEPETARVDEFNHHAFASQPHVERSRYRMWSKAEKADPSYAMVWGPYRRLRPGRYAFEPWLELDPKGAGMLSLDVALDTRWVVQRPISRPEEVSLCFTVDKPDSEFEFRIWAIAGEPAIDFSFFGGRLIREGAESVLHQSEYLMLLIELVAMRLGRTGVLGEGVPTMDHSA